MSRRSSRRLSGARSGRAAQLAIEPPHADPDDRSKHQYERTQDDEGEKAKDDGRADHQRADEYDERIGQRIAERISVAMGKLCQ